MGPRAVAASVGVPFSPAGDVDYSTLLLGMLVMQDVQLGLFIAVMPALIQAGAAPSSR